MSKKPKLQVKESLSLLQVLLITFILVIFIPFIGFLVFELLQNKIVFNFFILLFQFFTFIITNLPATLYQDITLVIQNIGTSITLAVLILLGIIAIIEWHKNEIFVEPFDVPEELVKKGYTGKVIAQQVVDKMHLINSYIDNQSIVPTGLEVNNKPDFQIPNTTISIYSLIQYFKRHIGKEQKCVQGSVIINENKTLTIIVQYGNKRIYFENKLNLDLIDIITLEIIEELLININLTIFILYRSFIKKEITKSSDIIDFDKIISILRDAISKNLVNKSDAYWLWGIFLTRQGKNIEAIEQYNKAIKLNPHSTKSYINSGKTYLDLQEYEKSLECYRKALHIESNPQILCIIYYNLGVLYGTLTEYDTARGYYIKAIEINPNDASIYNSLGLTYKNLKQYNSAIQQYNNAILLDPNHSYTYNSLGKWYTDNKDYLIAVENFNKAIKINPQQAAFHLNLGNVYFLMKQYMATISCYKKAIELDSSNKILKNGIIDNLVKLKKSCTTQEALQIDTFIAEITKPNP